jgi:SOS-response transcriptional repressor LexA
MEPLIHDGDYLVFRANPTGTRNGKIVLAQYRGVADPETGGAFTVKRYSSEKVRNAAGSWRHSRIVLSPLNPEYAPIVVSESDAESFRIVAEFVAALTGAEGRAGHRKEGSNAP